MAKIKTSKGLFHYTPVTLYLGIKQIDRDIAFDNLRLLMSIFEKHGLNSYPAYGTLLGIVRDNNFIEWDEDIDLFIFKKQEQLFVNLLWELKDNGFVLVRYERSGLYSVMRNGEYIDFYVVRHFVDNILYADGGVFLLEKYLNDTITWNFKGLNLQIPREYDDYLTFEYGDWRTPIKYADYEMPCWKKLYVKSQHYIKNHLPDFLYYPLLKKHHQKDLEAFKAKCAKKGIILPDNLKL